MDVVALDYQGQSVSSDQVFVPNSYLNASGAHYFLMKYYMNYSVSGSKQW